MDNFIFLIIYLYFFNSTYYITNVFNLLLLLLTLYFSITLTPLVDEDLVYFQYSCISSTNFGLTHRLLSTKKIMNAQFQFCDIL